jgi:serine/threonine protein kinase
MTHALTLQESSLIEGECSIEDFDVGVTLGTGSFGRVRFATHYATGRRCAIKMLKKAAVVRFQQVSVALHCGDWRDCKTERRPYTHTINPLIQVEHIMSEKEILLTLSKDPHPFLVNLVTTFNDEKYIYMVLDYIIGGEFFTHLRNAGTFDSNTAAFYSASVVLVFDSLHCKDIIYRDLKPEVRYMSIVSVASQSFVLRTFLTNNTHLTEYPFG